MEEIEGVQESNEPDILAIMESYEPTFPLGMPTISRVAVEKFETIIPEDVCCCCMGPRIRPTADEPERRSRNIYLKTGLRGVAGLLAYCYPCRRHHADYLSRRVIAVVVPTLLSAGVAVLLTLTAKLNWAVISLCQLVLALALSFGYALLFPLPPLGPEHGARLNPVDVAGSSDTDFYFDVANERYAYLLARLNAGSFETRKAGYSRRPRTIFNGWSAVAIVASIFVLWFLLTTVIGASNPVGP